MKCDPRRLRSIFCFVAKVLRILADGFDKLGGAVVETEEDATRHDSGD